MNESKAMELSEPQMEVVLALVIRGEEALLVRRTRQKIGRDGVVLEWGFPGGKIELGESKESAVVREVHEETGYRVSIERWISERVHPDFPVRVNYFLCRCIRPDPEIVTDYGTSEVRWVTASEVVSYMTSALDSHIAKVLADV